MDHLDPKQLGFVIFGTPYAPVSKIPSVKTGPILTVELGNCVIFGKVCKIDTLDDSLIELSNFTLMIV